MTKPRKPDELKLVEGNRAKVAMDRPTGTLRATRKCRRLPAHLNAAEQTFWRDVIGAPPLRVIVWAVESKIELRGRFRLPVPGL